MKRAKTPNDQPTKAKPDVPGVIRPEEVYSIGEFRRRTGLTGQFAWRQAKRRGLRILTAGKAKYVRGSDFIAYLDSVNK